MHLTDNAKNGKEICPLEAFLFNKNVNDIMNPGIIPIGNHAFHLYYVFFNQAFEL